MIENDEDEKGDGEKKFGEKGKYKGWRREEKGIKSVIIEEYEEVINSIEVKEVEKRRISRR